MYSSSRRRFIKLTGLAGAGTALGTTRLARELGAAPGKSGGRVVVVGGGFGGAACARYIKKWDPSIDVTLVERDAKFVTCPFSNLVLAGLKDIGSITQTYDALKDNHGVKVAQADVTAVDHAAKKVQIKNGRGLAYDRLVLAPGIDFRWGAIEGYDQGAVNAMPHAWKAGPQTTLLRQQLEAMKDGGVVIIAPPGNPFRCPPGPYERASLIAHYLKTHKPKSKILILDAKEKFSKQPLFEQGWKSEYAGMIEWVQGTAGGRVTRVDPKSKTVFTMMDDAHQGDVVNVIPPQKAGAIAHAAGTTDDSGWCPVDVRTFASTLQKGVHVIGDAAIAGPLPKSGYAALSQAKVCAAAIVSELNGESMPEPSYVNTCYSLLGPDYGVSVAMVYRLTGDKIAAVEGAGGVSPKDVDAEFRMKEARFAEGWYDSVIADVWG